MKKAQVKIGNLYTAKVSNRVVVVRLDRESPSGGWIGVNESTGREVSIRTAARLRKDVTA